MLRCCCLMALAGCVFLAAAEPTPHNDVYIDYQADQRSARDVLEHFTVLYDQQYTIDSALLQSGFGTRGVSFSLRHSNAASALQALCHALGDDIWWYADQSHTNIIITKKEYLPIHQQRSTVIYPSIIDNPEDFRSGINDILSPWRLSFKNNTHSNTDSAGGVSILGARHQWIATFNSHGHTDFARILGIIEHGRTDIPIRPSTTLAVYPALTVSIHSDQWSTCLQALGSQLSCAISIGQSLVHTKQNISITPCRAPDVIAQLRSYGVYAQWIDGVLCCDSSSIVERQHSASQRHIVGVSLHPYASTSQQQTLVASLRRRIMPRYWQRPGCALIYIPQQETLLIAAHNSALSAILTELRTRD